MASLSRVYVLKVRAAEAEVLSHFSNHSARTQRLWNVTAGDPTVPSVSLFLSIPLVVVLDFIITLGILKIISACSLLYGIKGTGADPSMNY